MPFDFQKMIKFYTKQLTQAVGLHGEDWRSGMIRERLVRVTALSTKPDLTREDSDYLTARQAVASTF